MANNNISRLLLFVGIAILVVLVMYFMPSNVVKPDGNLDKPGPVKDFKILSDSLKEAAWSSSKYSELKGKLESLKSQEVIGTIDALALEEYLDLAYAKSLQKACKDWMNSDGNTAETDLLRALQSIAINPKCAPFVTDEIDVMQCYFNALEIPGIVNNFLIREFDEVSYQNILNKISRYCGRLGIKQFARLQAIQSNQQKELEDFQTFANAYKSRMDFLKQSGPSDVNTARGYLSEFCPQNYKRINKYDYYLGDIQSTPGICE
ncbi:MAG: hypothetical protein FJX80_00570 [Bacteroidetes bacterium]|nr:hypothetical protein [Bacteroidota bacterium]